MVVEKLTGMSFAEYMKKERFTERESIER